MGLEAKVVGNSGKSFLSMLFDLSFDDFVTVRIIRVIYVISIIAAAIVGLFWFVTFASNGAGGAILALILVPIAFLLYVIIARVWLEAFMAIFKIAENTSYMARNGAGPSPRASTVTATRPPAAGMDPIG